MWTPSNHPPPSELVFDRIKKAAESSQLLFSPKTCTITAICQHLHLSTSSLQLSAPSCRIYEAMRRGNHPLTGKFASAAQRAMMMTRESGTYGIGAFTVWPSAAKSKKLSLRNILQNYKQGFKCTREPDTSIAKDKNVIARHHVEYSPCAHFSRAASGWREGERGRPRAVNFHEAARHGEILYVIYVTWRRRGGGGGERREQVSAAI